MQPLQTTGTGFRVVGAGVLGRRVGVGVALGVGTGVLAVEVGAGEGLGLGDPLSARAMFIRPKP